jgi:hypothetical protein
MCNVQTNKCRIGVLLIFVLFCMWAPAGLCQVQEPNRPDAAMGELKFRGQTHRAAGP